MIDDTAVLFQVEFLLIIIAPISLPDSDIRRLTYQIQENIFPIFFRPKRTSIRIATVPAGKLEQIQADHEPSNSE
ncbi:MAG: hypothetical protein ACE5EN_01645 [Nitrospinota bacterium]